MKGACDASNPFDVEASLATQSGGFVTEDERGGGRLCGLGCAIKVGGERGVGVEASGHGGEESG